VKPFSPEEARASGISTIPDEIIEAVNELLATKYRGRGICTIKQDDIMSLALQKMGQSENREVRQQIFNRGWMDFEPLFEKAGWSVKYDKPGYNESYDAFFEFSRKGD
jgi:hypothetical protein